MKFQCGSCKKAFVYAAKKTIIEIPPIPPEKIQPTMELPIRINIQFETHVCPFCQSLEIVEYVEPQQTPTSAVQVDWAEVDAKLKEGYVIAQAYAKNATMYKYKGENDEK